MKRVRCVDAHGTRLLSEGHVYRVVKDGGEFYQLVRVPGVWGATRFEEAQDGPA